jgi:hypothetical protein
MNRDDDFRGITAILAAVAVPLAVVVLTAAYALAQHFGWVPR